MMKYYLPTKYAAMFMLAGVLLHCMAPSVSATAVTKKQLKSIEEIYLTVDYKGLALEDVFLKLSKETEFNFHYNVKEISGKTIEVRMEKASLADILRHISRKSGLYFERIKETIHVLPMGMRKDRVVEDLSQLDQSRRISGTVLSAEDSQGLPGVNIVIKGTTQGTVTDASGHYEIEVGNSEAVLVFSFVGFASQEVAIGDRTSIDVTLSHDVATLEDVVVVGYGVQKKSDFTGAIVSADLEAFEEAPNTNILQSLQGALPGVQIGQVNQAGESPSISVRGNTTLNGNSDVLIVLDGIIFRGSMDNINPNDIKSIEVLKDASSKAIYGAQAANGVILITSKDGSKAQGKTQINYSVFTSLQEPTVNAGLLNREQFLRKVRDIDYKKSYLGPDYLEENPDWDYLQSALRALHVEGIDSGADHDWFKETTTTGYVVNNNLSLQGNTGKTSYYVSGNHIKQQGIIKNDKYKRSSLRINLETEVTSWLKFGVNSFGSFNDYSGVSPALSRIAITSPLRGWFDDNGEYLYDVQGNGQVNPFLDMMADDKDTRNSLSGNLYAIVSVPFVKGLSYRLNYNNNLRWNKDYNSNRYAGNQAGVAVKTNSFIHDLMFDNILSYEREFGGIHRINLTGVVGSNKINYENTTATGQGYSDLSLSYNSLEQAALQTIASGAYSESFLYQMIRAGYTLNNRYLINATLRRDGYSGFSSNNKIGLFPSAGVGWVISEESFFKSTAIEWLKIRGSFGQNGNLTERYSSLARVGSDQNYYYVFGDGGPTSFSQYPATMANNDLSWERTQELNVGIDFEIKNNRLNGSIDYYNTTTKDLLWNLALPTLTGFSSVRSNIGEINNYGIEVRLGSTIFKNENWGWNMDVSMSANRNRVVRLLGDVNRDGVEDDLISSGLFIGESIGTIYDFEIDGIWQLNDDIPNGYEPGTYRIVDQSGDGAISPSDDRIILGRSEPAYRFSVQNSVTFKNFSFKFFVNSVQGGKDGYMQANNARRDTPGNLQNYNWFNFTDYWSPSNPGAEYDAGWTIPAIRGSHYQQRNFVRLQDISLAYSLPKSLVDKIKMDNVKVFVSGKNLLTFTDWDGWDPETGQGIYSSDNYPVFKSYSIGLDIKF